MRGALFDAAFQILVQPADLFVRLLDLRLALLQPLRHFVESAAELNQLCATLNSAGSGAQVPFRQPVGSRHQRVDRAQKESLAIEPGPQQE